MCDMRCALVLMELEIDIRFEFNPFFVNEPNDVHRAPTTELWIDEIVNLIVCKSISGLPDRSTNSYCLSSR